MKEKMVQIGKKTGLEVKEVNNLTNRQFLEFIKGCNILSNLNRIRLVLKRRLDAITAKRWQGRLPAKFMGYRGQ